MDKVQVTFKLQKIFLDLSFLIQKSASQTKSIKAKGISTHHMDIHLIFSIIKNGSSTAAWQEWLKGFLSLKDTHLTTIYGKKIPHNVAAVCCRPRPCTFKKCWFCTICVDVSKTQGIEGFLQASSTTAVWSESLKKTKIYVYKTKQELWNDNRIQSALRVSECMCESVRTGEPIGVFLFFKANVCLAHFEGELLRESEIRTHTVLRYKSPLQKNVTEYNCCSNIGHQSYNFSK